MIQLLNILMAQAPAGMTQEEIHANNVHGFKVLGMILAVWAFFTIFAYIFNRILKKTGNHCTFIGAMPIAPIGNIICFCCRFRYFFMGKTWKAFNAVHKQKRTEKEKEVQAKKDAEIKAKQKEFAEYIKNKTKGLTDI